MSKADKDPERRELETESFEIIETAIDDIQLLVRAFDVINEVCENREDVDIVIEERASKFDIN